MLKTNIDIIDEKKNWSTLTKQVRNMSSANGNAVDIGVFQEQGKDLVDYATWNEFGVPKRLIPERSYVRSTFDTWINEMVKKIEANIIPVMLGKYSKQRLLNQIGSFMQKAMKMKIRTSRSWAAPNAPSTIVKKGKGKPPLIDTGRLLASITYKVVNASKVISQSVRNL